MAPRQLDEIYRLDDAVGMRPGDGDNTSKSGTRREQFVTLLIVVVMIALPIRLFVALRAELVSRDSAGFIWYAQGLERDATAEMRAQQQHPFYPAMVLASHRALEGMRRVVPALPGDPVKSWIAAAVAVTLLGGLAVVVAVYAVSCTLFDSRVALIAALLAAVAAEFCQLSGDALTDMPHLAVYLLGFAAAVRGVRDRSMGWLAAAGALSGIAYLIRPEGAEVAVVAAAGIIMARGPLSLRRRLAGAVLVCLAAGVIASPYMVVTGKIVAKKSLKQLFWGQAAETASERISVIKRSCENPFSHALSAGIPSRSPGIGIPGELCRDRNLDTADTKSRGLQPARCCERAGMLPCCQMTARAEARGSLEVHGADVRQPVYMGDRDRCFAGASAESLARLAKACLRIGENWSRSLRVMLQLPAVLWLAVRRRRPCEPTGARLAVGAIVLHLCVLTFLIVNFDYLKLFSLRHVMMLAALTLPFSAAGIAMVLDAVPTNRRGLAMALLAAGLIGPTLPWMLETRFTDALHVRRAGEWIREHDQGVPRIMTTRHLAALYANGVHLWCPWDLDAPRVLAEARQRRPNWLIFEDVPTPPQAEAFFEVLNRSVVQGEHLERVHETAGDGPKAHRAMIFRYVPPS